MRLVTGSAPHDRDRSGARHAGDGRMHDRVLARNHGGGALHAASRCGGSGRRGAHGERSVQRRHDRRRPDPTPHRTRAWCPAAVAGWSPLNAASAVGDEPRLQPRYAEVVLPVPVPRTYTYLIPAELAPRVVPGSRVVVPVRQRQVVGLVVAVDVPAPEVPARPIAVAPDDEPVLSAALI